MVRLLHPDFIFFVKLPDGTVAADIVDPHGVHLSDALPKIIGLCRYAEANASVYRRIEAVAEIDGKYRVLDLTEESVRKAAALAATATELYNSGLASDYS